MGRNAGQGRPSAVVRALGAHSAVARHDTYLKEKKTPVNVLAISWLAIGRSAGLPDGPCGPQARSGVSRGCPVAVEEARVAGGWCLAGASLASDRCHLPGRGRDS